MRVPVSEASDLNFLLYEPRSWIEMPLLWPTKTWMFQYGRERKEETTFDHDGTAVLIDHEGTTSVVEVRLGLKTPGRLAGAGSRGYESEACYNRALMLAAPTTPTITAAVHRYNFWTWITYNTLVMGRACSLRVPVSEANDLNYLL
jgi:hypothetical protein